MVYHKLRRVVDRRLRRRRHDLAGHHIDRPHATLLPEIAKASLGNWSIIDLDQSSAWLKPIFLMRPNRFVAPKGVISLALLDWPQTHAPLIAGIERGHTSPLL
jgi:hypothetical protein